MSPAVATPRREARPPADLLAAVRRLPVSQRIENGLRDGVLSINDARAIETLRRYLPDLLNAHGDLVAALTKIVRQVDLDTLHPTTIAPSFLAEARALLARAEEEK